MKNIKKPSITNYLRSLDNFNPGPATILHVSNKDQNTCGGGIAYLLVVMVFNYVLWTNLF